MAGAEEVVAALDRRPGVVYAGLVLNERGYDRLVATGLDEVHFAFAATETFNQRNQGAAVADSVAAAARIVARAREDGLRATVTIGASFGCPFEGRVDPERVLEIAGELAAAGPDEIVLADTIGVGVPRQVGRSCPRSRALGIPVGAHLHNTRNTGYANAWRRSRRERRCSTRRSAGSEAARSRHARPGTSPRRISSTCCTARGSRRGSTSTRSIGVAEWLEGVLGHELEGQVYRAGTFAPVAG